MRFLAQAVVLLAGALPTAPWAAIQTTASCFTFGGESQTGVSSCSASAQFGEQSVQTRATVSAGYGQASGFASVTALWGTAAAGGASFLVESTDRLRVSLQSDASVFAVFSAPVVTGNGSAAFDMINEYDLGLKAATLSTVASMTVSTPWSSYSTLGSVTETFQQNPDGYTLEVLTQGDSTGRIELFTGQELTISLRFGGSASAFGSASGSIGVDGGLAGVQALRSAADSFAGSAMTTTPMAAMYWQGIRFERSDGTPVSPDSVLLQSDSGTDWTLAAQPVPEPATLAMWAAGLGVLAAARRRRSLSSVGKRQWV